MNGPFTAWATVFERTAYRIRARFEPRFPHIHPHRLRHSFSMRTLEYLVTEHYRQAAKLVKDTDADAALVFYQNSVDHPATISPAPTPALAHRQQRPRLTASDTWTKSDNTPSVDIDNLATLVAGAVAGQREAGDRVLGYVRPLVVRYCRVRLLSQDPSHTLADEVAQETCLAVLTALSTYRDQGRPFLAFVYGIAAHKVADAHRAATRSGGKSSPARAEPEVDASVEQRALRAEMTAQMAELLSTLPAKQREILVLRVVVGLSAEETAAAVGSTPGAVRVAQHRALARLRTTATRLDLT